MILGWSGTTLRGRKVVSVTVPVVDPSQRHFFFVVAACVIWYLDIL